jgi:hypothetical protein
VRARAPCARCLLLLGLLLGALPHLHATFCLRAEVLTRVVELIRQHLDLALSRVELHPQPISLAALALRLGHGDLGVCGPLRVLHLHTSRPLAKGRVLLPQFEQLLRSRRRLHLQTAHLLA